MDTVPAPTLTASPAVDPGPDPPPFARVITARLCPQADHPMYAGHFPGFPITPGVFLVGLVHRAVRAALPDGDRIEISEITSCRFLGPAFPGDELTAEVRLGREDGVLCCAATVSTGRGPVTEVHYRCSPAGAR